nr:TrbI/VirB10 family protein [Candidatus Sarmatiella mevalonica]
MLISGGAPAKTKEEIEQENSFVKRGSNEFLLAKGKIIDVVLETAINTDFGGEITAIVSRDVFAEGGKNILIPKGSKAFGQYQAGLGAIYGRIAITWNRIDLLNGYTLNLEGVAVDNLGRTGIEGKLDHKFKEILTNSVFASLVNIGIGYGLDKLVPPVIQNQTAGANSNSATEINNLAFSIYQDPGKSDAQKIQSICGSVPPIIPLNAGDSYTQFVNTCNTLNVSPDPVNQKLQALMAAVNKTAVSIMTYTNNSVNPTQSQEASVQAFKDLTNTIKDMMGAQPFAMNITVNQGTLIKIYVNRDYSFPKHVVMKRRYVQ